jgi:hypothetical protein
LFGLFSGEPRRAFGFDIFNEVLEYTHCVV